MAKTNSTYKVPSYVTNDEVKAYVNKVVKRLKEKGIYEDTDKMILDSLAANYQIVIEAYKELEENGITSVDRYGHVIPSPFLEVKKNAENQCNKIIQNLGLSAKSRKALASDDGDDLDLEAMLNE